jgi:glyceraldehyde-3-phosphate dehydrogenase (NAD(P))
MAEIQKTRVAVNGYGVIGKRVAAAVARQPDMLLAGVSDVVTACHRPEMLDAFRTSSRIAMINIGDGLVALNTVKELMADRGRPHDSLYEVALWADMLRVQGNELFYAYMVDNQAIVIPETIDAIRALTGTMRIASESIVRTNIALGIETALI